MSENWKIQLSPRLGDSLINLRADNPEQFKLLAEWTVENAALFVNVQAALAAVPPALAGNVSSVAVTNTAPPAQPAPAPQQAQGGWAQPQGAAPSFAQPANQGPACQHGPMVYREAKPGSGKDWKAWFCPTPQGTIGQCKAQFVK